MPATLAGGTAVGGSLVWTNTAALAAAVATDVAIGTAAYGAYSTYQQGKYQEDLYKDQAGQSIQEAEQIQEASQYEERESRVEGRKLKARQFLQFAKGGVVPGTGTPLLVGEETATSIERDVQKQKYGYGLEGERKYFEADLYKKKGKAASRAARWSAGTSLLTGAYRTASIYR